MDIKQLQHQIIDITIWKEAHQQVRHKFLLFCVLKQFK